jgi:hypothetical protein
MPTKTTATLSIFVTNATVEEIVWNVTGYHAEGWSKGSVTWDGRRKSKVNICLVTIFPIFKDALKKYCYHYVRAVVCNERYHVLLLRLIFKEKEC